MGDNAQPISIYQWMDGIVHEYQGAYWGMVGGNSTSAKIVQCTYDQRIIEQQRIEENETVTFKSGHRVFVRNSNGYACFFKVLAPIDPCKEVVCDNVCKDYDLHSQKCVDGTCIPDTLLETNSLQCGYKLPNIKLTNFEFRNNVNQKIVNAKVNDTIHGHITVTNTGNIGKAWIYLSYINQFGSSNAVLNKMVDLDLNESTSFNTSNWTMINKDINLKISLQHLESQWIQDVNVYKTLNYYNPCEGVTCDNICKDYDLHNQKCVDGVCVPDTIIESNSLQCGFIPPVTIIPRERTYWIKSTLPVLNFLPGLPYVTGIPILPGFRISDKI